VKSDVGDKNSDWDDDSATENVVVNFANHAMSRGCHRGGYTKEEDACHIVVPDCCEVAKEMADEDLQELEWWRQMRYHDDFHGGSRHWKSKCYSLG
jgi:hypothetical protein